MKAHAQRQSQTQPAAVPQRSQLTRHAFVDQVGPISPHASAEGKKARPDTPATNSFAHDFSRIPVHTKSPVSPQAKLTVNNPTGIYERETGEVDEYRDEARKRSPGVQKKSLGVGDPNDADEKEADEVARKVVAGQSAEIRETGGTVNRKIIGSAETSPNFHSKLESSKGNGQALDKTTRSEMESKMGADFSKVKVHTGVEAHALSESINARAFTHGSDVYFRRGEFNTTSREGKELLAHELAHTVQQKSHVRRKIQPESSVRLSGIDAIVLHETDLSDSVGSTIFGKALYNSIQNKGYIAIKAKHKLELNLHQSFYAKYGGNPKDVNNTDKDGQNKTTTVTAFGNKEIKGRFDKYLSEIILSVFEAEKEIGSMDVDTLGVTIDVKPKLELLRLAFKGIELTSHKDATLDLLRLTLKGSYHINQANLQPDSAITAYIAESNPHIIEYISQGLASITGSLDISVSIKLKALAAYLATQYLKESKSAAQQKNIKNKEKYRKKGQELRTKRNEARNKAKELEYQNKKNQKNIEKLQKTKDLPPAQADEQIKTLEKEIADNKREAEKFREAWEKEQKAMEEAFESGGKEKQAAKDIGRDLKKIDKELKQIEARRGRFKKILLKLEQKLEKQRQKLNRIVERLAEKAVKWVEEKAVRWLGKKLAVKAAKVIAGLILRMIPFIGAVIFFWDVATLLLDIGSAIWDWISGKEGEGEGDEDGVTKGETGDERREDSKAIAPVEADDTKTVKGVPGGKTLDEAQGDVETGDLGTETKSSPTKGMDTSATDTKDTTTAHGKENPLVQPADTEPTVKTKPPVTSQTGKVRPWHAPSPNATKLDLISFGAVGLTTDKLISGELYLFKLVIRYRDGKGGISVVQSDVNEVFRYVGSENNVPKFKVETQFIIETNSRKIFFDLDYPIKVHK